MIIEKQGFERGANIRNKKYKVLEKRKYEVDDSFPKIINPYIYHNFVLNI